MEKILKPEKREILINKVNIQLNPTEITKDFDISQITIDADWNTEKSKEENIKEINAKRNKIYALINEENNILAYVTRKKNNKIFFYTISKKESTIPKKLKKIFISDENYKNMVCKTVTAEDITRSMQHHANDEALPSEYIQSADNEKYDIAWYILNLFSNMVFYADTRENTFIPNQNGMCIFPVEGKRNNYKDDPEEDAKYKEDHQIVMQVIEFTQDFHVNVKTKTLATIEKYKDYYTRRNSPKAQITPTLIQRISKDGMQKLEIVTSKTKNPELETFTFGNYNEFNRKNTESFNNIGSINKFNEAKMGMLVKYYDDMNKFFSKYIKLTFPVKQTMDKYNTKAIHFTAQHTKRLERISKKGIHIFAGKNLFKEMTAHEKNNAYNNLTTLITLYFQESENKNIAPPEITGLDDKPDKTKYNIELVWDKDIYTKKKIHDDHQDQYDAIIQHKIYSEEDEPKEIQKATPQIKIILNEQIFKEEIRNGQIFPENMNKNMEKTYRIAAKVIRTQDKTENLKIYITAISPEGKLTFYTYKEGSSENVPFKTKLISSIKNKYIESEEYRKNQNYEDNLEMIFGQFSEEEIFKDNTNQRIRIDTGDNYEDKLFTLYTTRYFPLPNLKEIKQILKQTDKDKKLNAYIIREIIQTAPIDEDEKEKIDDELFGKKEITLKELKILLTGGKKRVNKTNRALIEYVTQEYNKRSKDKISFESRIKGDEKYKIENIEGIYTTRKGDFIYYYVGYKNKNDLNKNQPRAIRIKKIYDSWANINIEKFIYEMIIDRKLREGLPVVPFSYKYLQEYVLQEENKEI